ncbi:PAS domain S-box protein [Roseateles saccharophilus]|nr:PAS domain S-box protein [Roseateles saccharophilus]
MLAVVIGLQVMLAVVSIGMLSAVRAYVTGESLYSKGQKDAQLHLLRYARSRSNEDYRLFSQALAVPLGDRSAREALQRDPPDLQAAREGFLAGGNHSDDIDGMVRLFRWFHSVPFMARPIATWTEGDQLIAQMLALVERAHEHIEAGRADDREVEAMAAQASLLNQRMTGLERQFSDQLGVASRQTKRMLLALNLALAAVLALTSVHFLRQSLRTRAAAAAEVRRRQESLQLLLDSAAEGLYGVDTEGRCTFINRSALVMLGYARESELVGRRIHDLIHHSHADGRAYPAGECRMYQAMRQVEEVHVADEVFWRRDGTAFQVEYWSHPVMQDGRVSGAVATFFDVTERLRTQAALRESEQRLSRLIDTVADGVIAVDGEERIVLFNRAAERAFGTMAEQALGQPIGSYFANSDRPRLRALMAGLAGQEGGSSAHNGLHELVGRRASGEQFPMEASLSRLSMGPNVLTTVVLRDISAHLAIREEREAHEALEASSRAKTDFLSRMSHELRTPLNAVLGFAQLLRMAKNPPLAQAQLNQVQHIEHAGHHLLALVNDVLDLSRVESGRLSLSLEGVALHAVADEAISMVDMLAKDAEVRIRRAFAQRPAVEREAWVVADRVRLRQVLVNLLGNAVKYNRRGGGVALDFEPKGGGVDCTIRDDGGGMTAEQLAHLFEPFNRLGAERTGVEGTGIGLVLSRHLVELMHGRLDIDSLVGVGTVATVRLQRADDAAAIAPAPFAPSVHAQLDGESLNVLYAEDNEVNVELMRQMVSFRPAVKLRVALNGAEAFIQASKDPPDLMLVDMHLGDMTGLELAWALRRNPATARVRLVAVSADALPEQIRAAMDRGFEGYLTKPIDLRQLLQVLDGHAVV